MSSSKLDQRKVLALRDPKLASANLIAFIVAACGGGGGGSSTPTPVIPSNSAPNAGVDTTISLTQDVTAGALNLSAPTDSDGDILAISVNGIPTSGTLNKADGTLIASGDSLTSAELQGLTFTPDANANDSTTSFGTFDYSVSDGNGGTDTRTVTISVDAVNDIPETEIVVTELAPKENTTSLTTFTLPKPTKQDSQFSQSETIPGSTSVIATVAVVSLSVKSSMSFTTICVDS